MLLQRAKLAERLHSEVFDSTSAPFCLGMRALVLFEVPDGRGHVLGRRPAAKLLIQGFRSLDKLAKLRGPRLMLILLRMIGNATQPTQ